MYVAFPTFLLIKQSKWHNNLIKYYSVTDTNRSIQLMGDFRHMFIVLDDDNDDNFPLGSLRLCVCVCFDCFLC